MKLLEDMVLIGPNRRSERTVIEQLLELNPDECRALNTAGEKIREQVIETLQSYGVTLTPDHPLNSPLSGSPVKLCASLVAGITLALQQHAGHRVNFLSFYPTIHENQCRTAFEYEQSDVGADALDLSYHLVCDLVPEIELCWTPIEDYQGFRTHFDTYMKVAPGKVLSHDAQAIIDAAARLDVPCVKLDRDPYEGISGNFRVRRNGMLKLGHACHQQVIDGTFCIDRNDSLAPLLVNRTTIYSTLVSLGVPVARRDPESQNCISSRRAVRAAERIGYPVVVKPLAVPRVMGNAGVALKLEHANAVRSAAVQALRISKGVIVEAHAPGRTFKIILANQQIVSVVALDNGVGTADVTDETHPSTLELALRLAQHLKPALMVLTVVSPDINQALEHSGAVVQLDVAPELDDFLRNNGSFPAKAIHDRAAEGLVRYLFPEGMESRIPLLAVTGTNGKTTICTMISQVAQAAGYKTGLASTTGFFIDDECIEFADLAGGSGHHRVLETPELNFGVLETARGAASGLGLMFDCCDVAICTNVTADHLGERGVETVADMAELKLFIMQRARHAVVLNADNEYSAGMFSQLGGRKKWMVSVEKTLEELVHTYGDGVSFCIAEHREGVEWIVLHDNGRELPVMPVEQVPITLNGRIRYNLSNALQVIAACFQMNVALTTIRNCLADFTPDYKNNPGRLNFYHGLPFTVLMDYAHNEDGHQQLVPFIDSLEVEGRKGVLFQVNPALSDEQVRRSVKILADHFDFFICRNYINLREREEFEVPALLKEGLLEHGIPESCIWEALGDDSLEIALKICRPGDLLLVLTRTQTLHQEWEQITSFEV